MTSRDSKTGKFAKRTIKLAAWTTLIALLVFGVVQPLFNKWYGENELVAHAANVPDLGLVKAGEQALLAGDIDALKDGVVNDIAHCESGGDSGIIIFDTNNEASVGSLQFQRKTVIQYEKSLEGKDVSKVEAIAIAINADEAHALARDIIFNVQDGWRNWFNCGVKVNAAARVAAINSLMK